MAEDPRPDSLCQTANVVTQIELIAGHGETIDGEMMPACIHRVETGSTVEAIGDLRNRGRLALLSLSE